MAEFRSAQSCEAILHRLMSEYEIQIRRMCCVYLRDEHLAEDATQETFLKAYNALDRFREDRNEKAWLMRIAVNVCHNIRRTGWMRFVDRRVTLDKLPEPASNGDFALTELMLDIMRLPEKLIDVVILHDYQELSVREIGKMLGIPYQTIISRLAKAHKLLRISLEEGMQK